MNTKDVIFNLTLAFFATPLSQLIEPFKVPNTTYPDAVSPNPLVAAGTLENQTSPPYYPSPWGSGAGGWSDAYSKAQAFVSQLSLVEKVNLTTGVGWAMPVHPRKAQPS